MDADHWDKVYQSKGADQVSWYEPKAELSLHLIRQSAAPKTSPIIDVGGGASQLVDGLVAEGWQDISVVDLSRVALQIAKNRLSRSTCQAGLDNNLPVQWLVGNITQIDLLKNYFYLWHDRAVFHFLTTQSDQQKYVSQVQRCLKTGGHLILATFALNGPESCSGLPVVRYDVPHLQAQLGSGFTLISSQHYTHHTPWGATQEFIYCHWQKTD